jgi:hypothetical protein
LEMTTEKRDHKRIICQHFDDALMEQMARLFGKGRLPARLPLNLLNVSCLVLLAEQQANEDKQFSTPEDRYTRETLFQELSEIGLDSEVAYAAMFELMLQLEYLHLDAGGLITGNEPALQMARHIDSILPQMPGLNLIAYIAQTIDEAVSGRKDLADAVDQFNQTLVHQGIPVGKRKTETEKASKQTAAAGPSIRRNSLEQKKPNSKKRLSAKDYSSLQQAFQNHAGSSANSAERRIISSKGSHEKIDVKVVSFGAPPPEAEATVAEKIAPETVSGEDIAGETPAGEPEDGVTEDGAPENGATEVGTAEDRAAEDGATEDGGQGPGDGGQGPGDGAAEGRATGGGATEDGAAEDRNTEEIASEDRSTRDSGQGSEAVDLESKDGSGDGDEPAAVDEDTDAVESEDDVIESRISAFEENLSMQCPICKSGEITAEKTIKKKTYFKCLNRACNFISWGKPYHMACPRCNNPFLIEQERNGRTILSCPRSTCNYWQEDPADKAADTDPEQPAAVKSKKTRPRRGIVKRRVVRRKKA